MLQAIHNTLFTVYSIKDGSKSQAFATTYCIRRNIQVIPPYTYLPCSLREAILILRESSVILRVSNVTLRESTETLGESNVTLRVSRVILGESTETLRVSSVTLRVSTIYSPRIKRDTPRINHILSENQT
ncbi:MAG: hypothetical protein LBH04_08425 [Tannerellaceae bacterium]|nr:hypothetical protein [Tannerellaceae bacterium]